MMHARLVVAAVMLAGAAAAVGQTKDEFVREGSGDRRASLDRMELKSMPASWDQLKDWHGEAVTRSTTSGKPVLIVTWASWVPQSVRALSTAQRLADEYDDLVVVGVHHKDGWAGAEKAATSREVTFPYAHDETNAFRNALRVDNDPDYYLIDRAGQLRFADLAPISLADAVQTLVNESEDRAANTEFILAQQKADAAAEQELLRTINQDIDELADVEVPFIAPMPDAYKDLGWPVLTDAALEDIGIDRPSNRNRNSNEPPPDIHVEVPQAVVYPSMPNLTGRIVAIYMWHPNVRASYWPDMNDMDVLQRKYGRDIRVIGVMVPRDQLFKDNSNDRDEETVEEMTESFNRFTRSRHFDHTLVLDATGQLREAFGGSARNRNGQTAGTSRLILLSSDGVLRWTGHTTVHKGPLDRMLRVDPGVRARQRAERLYIEGLR